MNTKKNKIQTNRKSNRLKGYDYSVDGYYFITICTKDKLHFFGDIKNDNMILNDCGRCVNDIWQQIPKFYTNIYLDEFIVMPNHIHGIVIIENKNTVRTEYYSVHAMKKNAPKNKNVGTEYHSVHNHNVLTIHNARPNISQIIKSFKVSCTKTIRKKYNDYNFGWHRSFYDHIIRDEKSLLEIQKYIVANPLKWHLDENNI